MITFEIFEQTVNSPAGLSLNKKVFPEDAPHHDCWEDYGVALQMFDDVYRECMAMTASGELTWEEAELRFNVVVLECMATQEVYDYREWAYKIYLAIFKDYFAKKNTWFRLFPTHFRSIVNDWTQSSRMGLAGNRKKVQTENDEPWLWYQSKLHLSEAVEETAELRESRIKNPNSTVEGKADIEVMLLQGVLSLLLGGDLQFRMKTLENVMELFMLCKLENSLVR